jgi:hypothetical protein
MSKAESWAFCQPHLTLQWGALLHSMSQSLEGISFTL